MSMKRIPVILVAFLLVCLPAASVRADAAPPEDPMTTGISPYFEYEKTYVRMYSEKITMQFVDDEGNMSVEAIFSMVNMGTEPEAMGVMFPLTTLDCIQGYQRYSIAPESFYVTVDGQSVDYHEISTDNPRNDGCPNIPWAKFDATFPVEQSVIIYISYMIKPELGSFGEFNYLLETGAGWYDTIGQVDINFIAPFEVTSENFNASPLSYQVSGSHVDWHWENLEPTAENNITLNIWSPEKWQELVSLRENVRNDPADARGWYDLGECYFSLGIRKYGVLADEYYADLAVEAFSQAVQLDPTNMDYRLQLAYILSQVCDFTSFKYQITSENVPACQQLDDLLEETRRISPNGEVPGWVDSYNPYPYYFGSTLTLEPSCTPDPPSTPTRTPFPRLSHTPTIISPEIVTESPEPNQSSGMSTTGEMTIIILVSLLLAGGGVYLLRNKIFFKGKETKK